MLVNHINDHVTHAVIGGAGRSREATMSSDAAFFQMLSTSLYKYQTLAMVREVICNAWDIHIKTGRTDKPLRIDLGDHFIVRDYGCGIPDENMDEIYLAYGVSTKVASLDETGGFGLGCKAPFAYTEHFQVTSWNQGLKTIYALSKSSAKALGKPALDNILSVPTTEEGLEVKVSLKDGRHGQDARTIKNYISSVVFYGGIKAILNGQELPVLSMAFTPGSWAFSKHHIAESTENFHVRYGNVVYPFPRHTEYHDELKDVLSFINTYNNANQSYDTRLIIQAKPGTISVQPSREGLSMQSQTIGALKELLQDILPTFNRDIPTRLKEVVAEKMREIGAKKNIRQLLVGRNSIFTPYRVRGKTIHPLKLVEPDELNTVEGVVTQVLQSGGGVSQFGLTKFEFQERIKTILENKVVDIGPIQRFLRTAERSRKIARKVRWHEFASYATKKPNSNVLCCSSEILFKKIFLRKIFRDLSTIPDLGHDPRKRLKAFGPHNYHPVTYGEAQRFSPGKDLANWLPYFRKIVVLYASKSKFEDHADCFPELDNLGGLRSGAFLYHMPLKEHARPAIREAFKKNGFTVLDLTLDHDWIIKPEKPKLMFGPPAPPEVKAKLRGIPRLDECLKLSKVSGWESAVASLTNSNLYKGSRIEDPKFVGHLIDVKAGRPSFPRLNHRLTVEAIRLFGAQGGLVNRHETTRKKWEKRQVPYTTQFFEKMMVEAFENSSAIGDWFAWNTSFHVNFSRLGVIKGMANSGNLIWSLPLVQEHFGYVDTRTEEEVFFCDLFIHQQNHSEYQHCSDEAKSDGAGYLYHESRKAPPHPGLIKALEQINNSQQIEFLNIPNIRSHLIYGPSGSQYETCKTLILDALNN